MAETTDLKRFSKSIPQNKTALLREVSSAVSSFETHNNSLGGGREGLKSDGSCDPWFWCGGSREEERSHHSVGPFGPNSRCGDAGRRSGITASFEGSREEERTQQCVGPFGPNEVRQLQGGGEEPSFFWAVWPETYCGVSWEEEWRHRFYERPREEERVCHSCGSVDPN